MQTVPYFVCHKTFDQCIANNPNDLQGQDKCKESVKDCGTLNATETTSSSSSSTTESSGSMATMATMATTTQASDSTATASSSPSSTPNAAVLMIQDHSTSLLAAGLFAALGFAL